MATLAISDRSVVTPALRRPFASVAVGLVGGAAAGMNAMVSAAWLPAPIALAAILAGAALLGAAVMLGVEAASRPLIAVAGPGAARALAVALPVSRLPALLPLLGWIGIQVPLALVVLLLLLARAGAVVVAMPAARRADTFSSLGWLAFLFLVSGFAALIYQIVWQRTLFTAFGVNIESITIVVSLFMFGLGVGAFVGGLVSHRWPDRAPLLFFVCEVGIGLFGVASLPLIDAVSRATLHGSPWQVSTAVFALLCVPTVLMGATLPILVTHLDRRLQSVGKSVGLLYCINTVGSAVACFLTADVLFALLGRQGAVLVAAGCNLLVGVLVFRFARAIAKRDAGRNPEGPATREPVAAPVPIGEPRSPDAARPPAHRVLVPFLAAAIGYVSLSQEMVWMRVIGYMTGGSPQVFAHVLGFFLLGVAFGAFQAERLCDRHFSRGGSPLRFVARMLLVSGFFYGLSIPLTAVVHDANASLGLLLAHVAVAVVSFLLGGLFPVLCHLGARSGRNVGLAVSRLYVANIVGCTVGPLLTGFVLMEHVSTAGIVLGLGVGTLLLAVVAAVAERSERRGSFLLPVASVAAAAVLALGQGPLYAGLLERLHMDRGRDFRPYRVVVENRHGIVSTAASSRGGADVIFGGAVYDGTMNTDPRDDSNWIDRCYLTAALHPGPKEVLEIGMSGASWTRVLADYGPVEHLTVVEINPGYLDVIRARDAEGRLRYPRQASVLDDPKVDVRIDDGRRWLNRHPDRRFDFILQNTTHHWRSQATNLLSEEYLRLNRSRLKPGGVLYLNSTFSYAVPYTAARVFRHVVLVRNFVAASDSPFHLTPEQIRENLLRFRAEGRPTFDPSRPDDAALLDRLSHVPARWIEEHAPGPAGAPRTAWDQADDFRAGRDVLPDFPAPEVVLSITDDNMATEFRGTRRFAHAASWSEYFGRLRAASESGRPPP